MADSLAQKKKFYQELSALDNEEDDSPPDTSDIAEALAVLEKPVIPASKQTPSRQHKSAITPRPHAPLSRQVSSTVKETLLPAQKSTPQKRSSSVSSTEPEDDAPSRISPPKRSRPNKQDSKHEVSVIKETPVPKPATAKRRKVAPTSSLPSSEYEREQTPMAAPTKKGPKKKAGLLEIPQGQQIFRTLFFYFFPNNDINKARRFRIEKAEQYGAGWVKDWHFMVTHIIVDREIKAAEVLKFLGLRSLPDGMVMVNDNFPAACIEQRCMQDPTQRSFEVRGWRELQTPAPEAPPASTTSTPRSLELKPVNGKVLTTPSVTEGSDERAAGMYLDEIAKKRAEQGRQKLEKAKAGAPLDALEEAILEAKATEFLPIDSDEDSRTSEYADDQYDSEKEEAAAKSKVKTKKTKTGNGDPSWQQNFTCMHKHEGGEADINPNTRTVEVLQQMANYYDSIKDQWRTLGYRKAIAALRKQPVKITTKAEAFTIPMIGERIAEKIQEIVFTNHLRQLDNATTDDNADVLQLFLKIYGVGHAQAQKFISQGHRTLEDLKTKVKLSENQKVGIDHYDDFLTRIPRHEVQLHHKFVKQHIDQIEPRIEVTVGGSYRRGSETCGDIDFIVTMPDVSHGTLCTLFQNVIHLLYAVGYLKKTLATNHSSSADAVSKWHGAAVLPGSSPPVWRRIDFLVVPWNEMGAALIYFTGNDIFNRSIRLLASKKGMRLNQRGLYKDVIRGPGREKVTDGNLLESKSEKGIFQILGVPYRLPQHRVC